MALPRKRLINGSSVLAEILLLANLPIEDEMRIPRMIIKIPIPIPGSWSIKLL
jgi:hypothetical protein